MSRAANVYAATCVTSAWCVCVSAPLLLLLLLLRQFTILLFENLHFLLRLPSPPRPRSSAYFEIILLSSIVLLERFVLSIS
jgi:hypothetical protein